MTINRKPHQVTDACDRHHCYSHHTDEPITPGRGTTCRECFHYFPTPLHLWADHQRAVIGYTLTDLRQARTDRTTRHTRTTEQPTTPAPPDDFAQLLADINQPPTPLSPLTYGRIIRNTLRHLTTPPRNIHTCPHCIHDL